jgi:endo-1,4-beta-mannosidase
LIGSSHFPALTRPRPGDNFEFEILSPYQKGIDMNRREFLKASAVVTGSIGTGASLFPQTNAATNFAPTPSLDLTRHRFGVNYTPSHNWWFCWSDWDPDPIRRDLDAISALAADHLRLLLIWPYFQPNLKWISPLHMERLDQLLTFMGERELDALVTIFTGQLSGWFFLPPFNKPGTGFYTDSEMWAAQELFIRQLAGIVKNHENVIGFDLGNELNTCWSSPTNAGDAWMRKLFLLIESVLPDHLNVNGVDEDPWFEQTTFSQKALISDQRMPVMHCYPYWSGALKYGGAMDPPSVKLLAAMASLIRSYAGAQQKPVWAGEFNTCIESLAEKQQAQWLERAVAAAIDQGVNWFSYWDSHDVDRRFAFNSLEYSLGLLTNEGKVKARGQVFKELANAYRGKPVRYPKESLAPPPSQQTRDATWNWMLDWMGWRPKPVSGG